MARVNMLMKNIKLIVNKEVDHKLRSLKQTKEKDIVSVAIVHNSINYRKKLYKDL